MTLKTFNDLKSEASSNLRSIIAEFEEQTEISKRDDPMYKAVVSTSQYLESIDFQLKDSSGKEKNRFRCQMIVSSIAALAAVAAVITAIVL